MTRLTRGVERLSQILQWIAGAALVGIMLLTVCDVILRYFGHPIKGTWELVGFGGGIAIGLALPITSWKRGHVYVDTFLTPLAAPVRNAINISTRLVSFALFLFIGWNLVQFGLKLRATGEVSPTLEMPFYPVVFGIALGCFLVAIILLSHVVLIIRGEYE